MPRIKEEIQKHMRSSMVSGMTHIRLDLDNKTSKKTLGYAPSMRELCTKCEGYGIEISKSKIENIESNECVSESSSIKIEAPFVTSFSSSISSRDTKKDCSSIFSS